MAGFNDELRCICCQIIMWNYYWCCCVIAPHISNLTEHTFIQSIESPIFFHVWEKYSHFQGNLIVRCELLRNSANNLDAYEWRKENNWISSWFASNGIEYRKIKRERFCFVWTKLLALRYSYLMNWWHLLFSLMAFFFRWKISSRDTWNNG